MILGSVIFFITYLFETVLYFNLFSIYNISEVVSCILGTCPQAFHAPSEDSAGSVADVCGRRICETCRIT